MNLKIILLIALGGSVGATLRGLINKIMPFQPLQFSYGTFAINLLGCFFIGVLWNRLNSDFSKSFWITGVLGGFTTFSGFGLEILRYLDAKEFGLMFGYAIMSVILGVLMVWAGQKIA